MQRKVLTVRYKTCQVYVFITFQLPLCDVLQWTFELVLGYLVLKYATHAFLFRRQEHQLTSCVYLPKGISLEFVTFVGKQVGFIGFRLSTLISLYGI